MSTYSKKNFYLQCREMVPVGKINIVFVHLKPITKTNSKRGGKKEKYLKLETSNNLRKSRRPPATVNIAT